MRIHFAGKLFFTLCLLTITTCLISAAPSKKAPEFPEGFPEELRKAKFLKKESRILAPGVTYYHYHFDSVLPKGVGPFYRVQYIFTNANGKTAIQRGKALPEAEAKAQDEAARKKIGEAYKELKGSAFVSIAKRYSDAPGAKREKTQITFDTMISEKAEFCSDEIKKAVLKLKETGDYTKPVKGKLGGMEGYFILRLQKLVKKMPASIYYVIVDWDQAKVKFKLRQCGKRLKTVADMVEDERGLIAAVNGAYFTWRGPATFYPFKEDGQLFDATGYDSKTGFCFNEGEFPVLDVEGDDKYGKYANVIVGYHIMKNGKYTLDTKPRDHWATIAAGTTPHTALGLNPETKRVVMFVCDGRFPEDAPGFHFYGEYYFLKIAGCTEGLSIDGGGSTTMLVAKEGKDPVNHPSDNRKFDHKGARAVWNCVFLVEDKSKK